MPRFSRRRGAPCFRQQLEQRPRCGRRPGNAVPCLNRLEGWIRKVAARAPIWGDLHIDAFCKVTGYSREHTMRQLSKLRASCEDLAFETKIRCKRGKKRWGVIVAQRSKLLYDRRSLFYDHRGRPLHNYTNLGRNGFKIDPSPETEKPLRVQLEGFKKKSIEPCLASSILPRLCDVPSNRKDSKGIQQFKSYGARRDMGGDRGESDSKTRLNRSGPLRRKAFVLLEVLARGHWDNCKVKFSRRAAFCYAWRALLDGHDVERISSCYSHALFVCHGVATDMGCRMGKPVFFNLSSTVAKSRKMLNADGLSRSMRMARWYASRRRNRSGDDARPLKRNEPIPFPTDTTELRRLIAESLRSADLETPEGG